MIDKSNIIIYTLYEDSYSSLWLSLSRKLHIKRIFLFDKKDVTNLPIFNKFKHIFYISKSLGHRKLLRLSFEKPRTIILVGHIILPFLFYNYFTLAKIKYCKTFVFASFFHNTLLMRIYGILLRPLLPKGIVFLAFSKADIPLYNKYFALPFSQIKYLPYGSGPVEGMHSSSGDYCFAGGYSNRNYAIAIDAFSKIDEKLIICCSKKNKLPSEIPRNITVFKDLPLHKFIKLLSCAKLCIMTLNPSAGACGQSVTLKYMQCGKPIIATNTLAIRDYLNDRNAYIIEPNNSQEMVNAVVNLIGDEEKRKTLGEQAKRDYYENHTAIHFEERLLNLLMHE